MTNCCFSSWRKNQPVFDSEWHWSVWHQKLLRWRHEWLLFQEASELSRLALKFITLLAFCRQSWRKNLHLHCTCHQRSQSTWLISAHIANLYLGWGQKFPLPLLPFSQAAFSPRLAMTTSHQGHAVVSPPCHTYQFYTPCFSPKAMENCLQKRLLERK